MITLIFFLNMALINAEYDDGVNYGTDKTIPGLEYLGSGYNAVAPRDCKETDTSGINFKNPVLRLEWEDGISLNNTLEWIHPKNTYIWNYPSCFFTEKTSKNSSDYTLSTLVDAKLSVDLIKLDGDVAAETHRYEGTKNEYRLKEAYCSVFVAGTFFNAKSELASGFLASIKRLEKTIISERRKGCTFRVYRKRVCARVIEEWKNFFENFGTHVVTKVVLGGKMLNSRLLDSKNDGTNSRLDAGLKFETGKTKVEANLNDHELANGREMQDTEFTLEGGKMDNIEHLKPDIWSKSLRESPIPIKVVLTSYREFFQGLKLKREYIRAINLLFVKNGKRKNLKT